VAPYRALIPEKGHLLECRRASLRWNGGPCCKADAVWSTVFGNDAHVCWTVSMPTAHCAFPFVALPRDL
jgi:hypothetical protein